MKENLTEIICILDRSGSMYTLERDTIDGFNSFINKQKQEDGEAIITTVLFDDKYEILHNGIDIKKVNALTSKEYYSRGYTALLDAIGITINNVNNRLKNTLDEEKPSKVIFLITTDGEENSSREFTKQKIKNMITQQQNEYNWEFMFVGANIDAVSEAESIGINGKFASNYTGSGIGTQALYTSLSNCVTDYRATGKISAVWKEDLK